MNFQKFKAKYEHKPVTAYPNQIEEEPMVSVCVQTYQHSLYIRECLNSILMQKTEFPFEILLGEDGSTDGTRKICIEYAKKHPGKIRLFLHHRENNIAINGKPSGRFNMLYNLFSVKGKYVALCEGDDYWTDPLKLQKQMDFMEKHPDFSLCFHNAKVIYESGKTSHKFKVLEGREYTGEEILREWTIPTGSSVFRSDAFDRRVFCNGNFKQGDIVLFLILLKSGKGYCLSGIMSVYRKHERGATATYQDIPYLKRALLHFQELKKQFPMYDVRIHNLRITKFMIRIGWKYLKNKPMHSLNYFFRAFMLSPTSFWFNLKKHLTKK